MAPSSHAVGAAFLSTGLISLAPNIVLFLFPGYSSKDGARFLSIGQAVASGGLLGDVFLHTLPHAAAQSQDPGLWVLAGFTVFFAVDLLIRSLEPQTSETSGHGGHEAKRSATRVDGHSHAHASPSTSLAVLNLTADALHNFTDGLAIGAGYAASHAGAEAPPSLLALLTGRGGLASLAILLHELPHELGDYCTLLRAGYSKAQAIRAQFLTAVAAFAGTAVALFAVDHGGAAGGAVLLLLTAGGFLYLAATTVLPEVLQDVGGAAFRGAQLLAFLAGLGLLHLVARMEHDAGGGHGHGHGVHGSHDGHRAHHHHSHEHGEL